MTIHPTTPAAAARRQLLQDRFAEYLAERGAKHPDDYARDLLGIVAELGFRLPAAIEDAPPPPASSHDEHRRAVLAPVRAQLEARRSTAY